MTQLEKYKKTIDLFRKYIIGIKNCDFVSNESYLSTTQLCNKISESATKVLEQEKKIKEQK